MRRHAVPDAVLEDLEVVYPLALQHVMDQQEGQLRVVPEVETLARQDGLYRQAGETSSATRRLATEVLCGWCKRCPVWADAAGSGCRDSIPCPEPCSFWLALCKEALGWEKEMPPRGGMGASGPLMDFAEPGNAVREQMLARMRVAGTAETSSS